MNTVKTRVLCCMFLVAVAGLEAAANPAVPTKERSDLPIVKEPAPALHFDKLLLCNCQKEVAQQ